MKFRNRRKFILLTVMAALLVFIPIQSGAVTKYNSTYNTQGANYLNTMVIRLNNGRYTVARNQNRLGNSYYTIVRGQNKPTNNYYIVSRGNYIKLTPQLQPIPEPQPAPRPEPQPQPTPRPEPNPDTTPDAGDISNGSHSLTPEEIQMVDYVNQARQDAGLKPLQIDADLAHIARLKSRDMYDNNYFSHDSPTYGSPFDMMTKFGIKYSGAAENIAKNSSVAAAHNAFMRSQGHKNNILNPIYTHIGVGIHNGYYTQMFIRK